MPINSSSIPALRIARNLRRKKRAEGGAVFPEDIKRVHIRSDAPAGADESAMAGRTSTVPSWGMTSAFGTLSPGEEAMSTQELGDSQSSNFISKAGSVIGGIAKGLFYDFPKNMIDRSVQNPQPGLRREDFTDIPPDTSPDPKSAFGGIGVDVPRVGWQPVDPMVGSSLEAAGNMAGVSAPFIQKNALGIFGGRLAQTADHAALARAEKMSLEGVAPEVIWKDTGWFKGADDKWRFEIDDSASGYKRIYGKGTIDNYPISTPHTVETGAAYQHPDLYAAYPDLEKVPLQFRDLDGARGQYSHNPSSPGDLIPPHEAISLQTPVDRYGANMKQARSTTLHELQHAVQTREGFVPGGSPAEMQELVRATSDARVLRGQMELGSSVEEAAAAFAKAAGRPPHPAATKIAQELPPEDLSRIADNPHEAYRRLSGEVEARNVQTRQDLPDVARANIFPRSTEDVLPDLQTLGRGRPGRATDMSEIDGLLGAERKLAGVSDGRPPTAAAGPAAAPDPAAMGPGGGGTAGVRSLPEAQAAAARWAGERAPLEGLPGPLKIGEDFFVPGPIGKIHDVAEDFMRTVHPDRPYTPPTKYHPIDPEHSQAIAKAYEEMKHTPSDPATKASYDALIDETAKQYDAIKKTGLKIEPVPAGSPDPYAANPRLAAVDVAENNHLWFFPTESGFGTVNKITDNPMLRKTGEKIGDHEMLANDMFRVVHDYFGHLKQGHGFRAAGEDNAWRMHSQMYSDLARPAMTTETRGQNSLVNYSNTPLYKAIGEDRARELYGNAGRKTGAESGSLQRSGVSDSQSMPGLQPVAQHDGALLQPEDGRMGGLRGSWDNGASADANAAGVSGRHGASANSGASDRPLPGQQRSLRAGERPLGDASSKSSQSTTQRPTDAGGENLGDVGMGGKSGNIPTHAVGPAEQVRLDRGAGTDVAQGEPRWKTITVGEHNRTASGADTVYADQKVGLMPEWTMRDRGTPPPIMVYHGSPHHFNRADISKIGTGEGNQAYGHGLYFAGHEPVSEWYRHQLATRQDPLLKKYKIEDVGHVIGSHLSDAGGDAVELAKQYAMLRQRLIDGGETDKATKNMIKDYDNRIRYLNDPQRSTGHMYQFGIDVPPEKLLDYDLPFVDQSQHVQGRVGPIMEADVKHQVDSIKEMLARGSYTSGRPLPPGMKSGMEGRLLMLEQAGHKSFPGKEIYKRMGLPAKNEGEAAVKASKRLLDMDVPGLRYADAGSRAPGQKGSHNFVMFGDNMLRLLRQYGVVGIPAAGVLGVDGEERRARGGRVARRLARKKRAEGGSIFGVRGAQFGVMSPGEEADLDEPAPIKIVRGLAHGLGDVAKRSFESSESMRRGESYDPKPVLEAATLPMGVGLPLGSNISKAGEFALGVVPVDAGRAFKIPSRIPDSETFRAAVKNTPGAASDAEAMTLPVMRRQQPDQELADSVRGGVFYLPEGSPQAKFYNTGTRAGAGNNYGGSQLIKGETAVKAPLFVKGATGGKAPEVAMDTLLGKGSYQKMRDDAMKVVFSPSSGGVNRGEFAEQFLGKYAPELTGMGRYIVENSSKGNQLAYALSEAAVASAARRHGYDAVVGYSTRRGPNKDPFISEVFDVRESHYPSPSGGYQTWPAEMFTDSAMNVARSIKRAKGGRVHVGPIVGDTGGRADKRPMEVPDGAYVLTADHVSGLGEGNTEAGMKKLGPMFPNSKPSKLRGLKGKAVPIYAADGEFVIHPDDIIDRFGELDYGHRSLDAWQTAERKQLIKTLKNLAPPAQD